MSTAARLENEGQRGSKQLKLMLLLGFVFLSLVIITFDNFQIGLTDDAHYIALARSLAMGNSYSYPNFPATLNIEPIFPIGFPLALAPILAFFPNSLDTLKLVALITTLANGGILFYFWPQWTRSSSWWAVGIAGGYWFLPLVVRQARMMMSESLFLMLYLLLVAVAAKCQAGNERWWSWPAMGLLAISVIATRTIGLAVVVGVGISFLLNHHSYRTRQEFTRTMTKVIIGGLLLGLLLIIAGNSVVPKRYWQEGNARYFRAVFNGLQRPMIPETQNQVTTSETAVDTARFGRKVWHHIRSDIPNAILPGSTYLAIRIDQNLPQPLAQFMLAIGVLTLILLGSLRWIRLTGWHVLWISGSAYLGVLLFWAWSNNPRLLYPIVPHLLYALFLGCETFLQLIFRQRSWRAGRQLSAIFLVAIIGSLLLIWVSTNLFVPSVVYVGDLASRTIWLKENAKPEQIVMTEYPLVDYLYLPLQTVNWPTVATEAQLRDYLLENQVDYLLFAPEIKRDENQNVSNLSENLAKLEPLVKDLERGSQVELLVDNEAENLKIYQVIK